jgi:hypothetical protein
MREWTLAPTGYKRHRFPPDIIQYAVWLYFRFKLVIVMLKIGWHSGELKSVVSRPCCGAISLVPRMCDDYGVCTEATGTRNAPFQVEPAKRTDFSMCM